MSMRIDGFKQAIRDGGARPNLFEVTGSFAGLAQVGDVVERNNAALDDMKFLIKAASLPASNVSQIAVPYRGRQLKMAGDREFEPWTITVINTNDFRLRNAFEAWSELINGHETNRSSLRLDEYFRDWSVNQIDRTGKVSETYTLVGCYPSVVGAISLSHESNNIIEEFEVTLEYQYWTHKGITQR